MNEPLRNITLAATLLCCTQLLAQQPPEPVDPTPQDGQAYAVMNQASGLQLTASNQLNVSEAPRDLTSPQQRWALTRLADGSWKLVAADTGNCLTETPILRTVHTERCSLFAPQRWLLTSYPNGYYSVRSQLSGLYLNSNGISPQLDKEASTTPSQAQLWQLRPAFWRGTDIAEQEKMEALRLATNLPWWKDDEQPQDLLGILKNHGVNSIRIRPTSIPPYYPGFTVNACTGNACYIETDAQGLDLARRARQLGMSLELTLFFDGGSSQSTPGSWAADTQTQLAQDVYTYTKAEIEKYRAAGLLPDMVSIGNEVDTGFLEGPGVYPYNNFAQFAALERAGLQAVSDAAADPSLGAPLPPPLTCIHITPGYNMTSFFTSANGNGLQYDAICQSYYPIYHGPLTDAQAATSNPDNQPVEADVLLAAAQTIAKPIYILETAEHYENGFGSNDPWYPATTSGQRQFLLDLEGVLHNLPNHLGLGMEYWAPNDVEMPDGNGPYSRFQQDYNTPEALFEWEGLALFDSADPNYLTNPAAPNYSTALPGLDALGGIEDATRTYKIVNRGSDLLLDASGAKVGASLLGFLTGLGAPVDPAEQWRITSNGAGHLVITNVLASTSNAANTLAELPAGAIALQTPNTSTAQAWELQTAGNGYFYLVNQADNTVLSVTGTGSATSIPLTTAGPNVEWSIKGVPLSSIN